MVVLGFFIIIVLLILVLLLVVLVAGLAAGVLGPGVGGPAPIGGGAPSGVVRLSNGLSIPAIGPLLCSRSRRWLANKS